MSEALQQADLPIINSRFVFAYDIETLKSYFSAAFIDVDTEERFLFEVFEVTGYKVNNIKRLFDFLDKCKGLVGYNNLYFDYPVIHHLMENKSFVLKMSISELIEFIYVEAQRLIDRQSKFKYKVPDDKVKIPQLDLMVMNYFNSKARFVSLKQMEFVMRYENVQDMPYSHRFIIKNRKQAKEIADYNFNDVDATLKFYRLCEPAISLRRGLSKKYGINLISEPDTNLAKEVFAKHLTEDMGITRQELNKMRTVRKIMDVGKEVILPFIKFDSPELNKVLEFFKMQKVTFLKGFFTKIKPKSPGYDILKEISNPKLINPKNKNIESFNVVFDNHTYVFGSGGIHSKIDGKSFVCKEDEIIVDADVTSFYISQCIKYGFKPEHLGQVFITVCEFFFNERTKYKKGTIENAIYKLCLTSSYGQSGNEYSYLHDLLMMISICINGQLLLMMFNEKVVKECGGTITTSNTK